MTMSMEKIHKWTLEHWDREDPVLERWGPDGRAAGEPRLQTAACVWAKGNVAPVAVLSEGLGRGVSTVKTLQSEYQRD